MGKEVQFFNRYTQKLEQEQVYGEAFLRFLYSSAVGKLALNQVVKRKAVSDLYGWLMRWPSSKKKIKPFVEKYQIDTSMCVKQLNEFTSFNDFFTRQLKINARPIAVGPQKVVFPADGRHLYIPNLSKLPSFFVKGQQLTLKTLLQNEKLAQKFKDGVMVISRLAPVDYHRFHFPCNSRIQRIYLIKGDYKSVNPIATRERIAILCENKRIVSVLQSEDLGPFLMVEVGATCVGSITQTAEVGRIYYKGEEKGFFSFGGSTVITIFQKNKIRFAEDLCENSGNGIELYALMGDGMGIRI
ncbi:MAG: archaetidylserine decarboxylase [Verrucomicrobiota bacterium]|nr:MAG: archaetidylserine decarboxylase [Verrucomicrobiota bacterium]